MRLPLVSRSLECFCNYHVYPPAPNSFETSTIRQPSCVRRVLCCMLKKFDVSEGEFAYQSARLSRKTVPRYVYDSCAFCPFVPDTQEYHPCGICRKSDDEGNDPVCDTCGTGYHLGCLGLPTVPKGKWLCPSCQSTTSPRSASSSGSPTSTQPGRPARYVPDVPLPLRYGSPFLWFHDEGRLQMSLSIAVPAVCSSLIRITLST